MGNVRCSMFGRDPEPSTPLAPVCHNSALMISLDDIEAARQVIQGQLHRTPMAGSSSLSRLTRTRLTFKLELFQKTGSFKVRGVLNKLHHLSDGEKARGVIGMSSGNHAQALAYGASLADIPATIVMPDWSVSGKVEATKAYGGEVVLTAGDVLEVCSRIQRERNLVLVHPFDDPRVIAGAGTLGLEILEDIPAPDVVLVGIGGGGLISGVAAAIKLKRPETRIIGVEPAGAAVMTESLRKGRPVRLDKVDTVADGLAAPFTGEHTLEHVREYVDEIVVLSDAEILEAMRLIIDRCKVVAEPSAAACLAPLLAGRVRLKRDSTAVCLLCGGNIDSQRLKELL